MEPVQYAVISGISLVLGFAAGFIMYRSDFCLAGAFRDLFLFKSTFMLKALFLLVISTMVLFEAGRLLGLLPIYPFPLLYSPTLANFIGGVFFGVGMVLAGGCVVGTLYKIGSGSMLSVLALVGLVLGSAVYAEFHPAWASFIKATTFFKGKVTIPQLLGISPTLIVVVVAAVGGYFIFSWYGRGTLTRRSFIEGYLQPWKAAILLSIVSLYSYIFIGLPLGVTSSYAKIAGYAESVISKDHVAGLAFFKGVPLKCTNAYTGGFMSGGSGPTFDAIAAIQFPLVFGIILGSAIAAMRVGEFSIKTNAPWKHYASALAGGTIMGLASRMAPTCNVWHLMGGLPVLAMSSMLFFVGLLPGAWIGGKLLVSLVMDKGGR